MFWLEQSFTTIKKAKLYNKILSQSTNFLFKHSLFRSAVFVTLSHASGALIHFGFTPIDGVYFY